MTGHLKTHLKHMIVGGAGLLVLLVAFGVSWQQALTWALLAACPLGMMAMMWFMRRQDADGASHDQGAGAHSDVVPQQRVQRVNEGSPER
jgi:hypothetical protein